MDWFLIAVIIGITFLLELILWAIKICVREAHQQRAINLVGGILITALFAFFVLVLGRAIWISATLLNKTISFPLQFSFWEAGGYFVLLFILAIVATHLVAYCFSGLLHQCIGADWPEYIDYLYYLGGAFALILIVANIFGDGPQQYQGIKLELIAGTVLLNLKLLKTSHKVSSGVFDIDKPRFRTPYLGAIW